LEGNGVDDMLAEQRAVKLLGDPNGVVERGL